MYKIVGADQKEYGPVTEEQMRQWIADGRANAQTLARFGDGPWKQLSTFPEFANSLGTLPPPSSSIPPLSAPPPPLTSPITPGALPPATSGMAVAGLTCSILGLFCCGPIFSTLGLVFSALALSQINQNPSRYTGKNMAIAGLVLALIGYVIFAVLLISGVFGRAIRGFPRRRFTL